MLFLTDEMKREIILEHYSSPDNKKEIKEDEYKNYEVIRMDSDSCIDDITIFLKKENGIITECFFNGVGCALSTAATDILCNLVINKDIKDALYIIEQYENMLHEKEFDAEVLDELIAFSNTYKQAARIKCASIGAEGITKIIKGENKDE